MRSAGRGGEPPLRLVRRFFVVWFPAFLGILFAISYRSGRMPVLVPVFAALAATSAFVGWYSPERARPVYAALDAASAPIGRAVSRAVLLLVFFGVVTPVGLIRRLAGRDRVLRPFDPREASYWEPRAARRDPDRWFRQF